MTVENELVKVGGTTELYQRIGYLLARTASDYGDNFVMLQLDVLGGAI